MLKISVYIPEVAVDAVKQAMFDAGAGAWDHYDQVCWQTVGQGQFRPLAGAHPALGTRGSLHFVTEIKVEMLCDPARLFAVVAALKQAHPYEAPAFDVMPCMDLRVL